MNDQLVVHTNNPDFLGSIYNKKPEANDSQNLDEVLDVQFISEAQVGKGFGGAEMAVTIVISLVTGVGSGIIANLIYDKIMEKGKNRIVIKEKRVTITTKDELIEYVEKNYFE